MKIDLRTPDHDFNNPSAISYRIHIIICAVLMDVSLDLLQGSTTR